MNYRLFLLAAVLGLGMLNASGCAPTPVDAQEAPKAGPPQFDFPIMVTASLSDGTPVPGAVVKIDGREAGKTGNSGIFEMTLREQPRVEVEVEIEEPDGYSLKPNQKRGTKESLVALKQGDDVQLGDIRFDVLFDSMKKDNLVWVRLNCDERVRCSNIPIRMGGKVMGVTNDFGVAHFVGSSVPDRQVELVVDTPDDTPKVVYSPSDPKFAFQASLTPTVYYIEESFVNEVPPPVITPAFTGKRSKKKSKPRKKRKTTRKKKKSSSNDLVPVLSDKPKKKKKPKTKKKPSGGPIDLF